MLLRCPINTCEPFSLFMHHALSAYWPHGARKQFEPRRNPSLCLVWGSRCQEQKRAHTHFFKPLRPRGIDLIDRLMMLRHFPGKPPYVRSRGSQTPGGVILLGAHGAGGTRDDMRSEASLPVWQRPSATTTLYSVESR